MKPIPKHKGYHIDRRGNVYSIWKGGRYTKNSFYDPPKKLTGRINQQGYRSVNIKCRGKMYTRTIHRLIAITYISNPNNHPCVLHKNDVKLDNKISNLYWGTQKENCRDIARNGNSNRGERNGQATLTEKQVIKMKELFSRGIKNIDIAKVFKVTPQTIGKIRRGERWKYLSLTKQP